MGSAGVADRIDVVLGPAADGLAALPDEPHVDLAFIDADKSGYATYVDLLLPRLRPGGLLALDNTLWSGAIADPRAIDANTVALRELNDALAARDDVDVLPLTIGDGVTLVRPAADPNPNAPIPRRDRSRPEPFWMQVRGGQAGRPGGVDRRRRPGAPPEEVLAVDPNRRGDGSTVRRGGRP